MTRRSLFALALAPFFPKLPTKPKYIQTQVFIPQFRIDAWLTSAEREQYAKAVAAEFKQHIERYSKELAIAAKESKTLSKVWFDYAKVLEKGLHNTKMSIGKVGSESTILRFPHVPP